MTQPPAMQAAGASGAAAAYAPPPVAQPLPDEVDVAVVGGGLAGLTSATALAQRGLRVLVLERDSILGGRARSWTDPVTGDPVHIGPHILLNHYPNFLKLLELCGTRDRIVWQRPGHFITLVDGRTEVHMRMAPLPPPMPFVPSVFRDPTLPLADKLSNFPVTLYAMQLDEEELLRLDGERADHFLKRMGVSQRYVERFWAFTALAILNVPLDRCSTGALLRFYRRLIGHGPFRVGFADGGLGDLFAPGARRLIEEAGGIVRTRAWVTALLGDTHAVRAVKLRDGTTVRARHVVAALPPHQLRPVLLPDWLEHPCFHELGRFHPCPYVSVYLWFDRKLTDRQFWARYRSLDSLNCDFYDLSNIHTGWAHRPSVITSNIIYSHRARTLSDAEIVARTVAELADYLPEAARARVRHSVVNRIPMAIHCPHPGTERRRPEVRTPVRGLYLSGDWIRTGLPSSMESAVMAGFLTAERILAREGRPERLALAHQDVEGFVQLATRAGSAVRFVPRLLDRWLRPPRPWDKSRWKS